MIAERIAESIRFTIDSKMCGHENRWKTKQSLVMWANIYFDISLSLALRLLASDKVILLVLEFQIVVRSIHDVISRTSSELTLSSIPRHTPVVEVYTSGLAQGTCAAHVGLWIVHPNSIRPRSRRHREVKRQRAIWSTWSAYGSSILTWNLLLSFGGLPVAEVGLKIFHGQRELSELSALGPIVASPSKLATVEWVSRAM